MNGKELKKEFGDYQTPRKFARKVCEYLYNSLNIRAKLIIEPEAGIGNFIKEALLQFNECEKIVGIEINNKYCDICKDRIKDSRLVIECANFFEYDLEKYLKYDGNTLVIGNPPWVTNSDLRFNLPQKTNFKGLKGIEAITGSSNFDICEYIIWRIIETFKKTNATISMLCKTSVARKIILEIQRSFIKTEYIKILNFNSNKVFGVNVSSCVLVIKLSKDEFRNGEEVIAEVYDEKDWDTKVSTIRCRNGFLLVEKEEEEEIRKFDGKCQYEWRQGVKHDCSSVMELEKLGSEKFKNKRKEEISLEDTLVFPLIKSSDFKRAIICKEFKKYVIVTQKKTKEDTSYIKKIAPNTWKYLNDNKELFDNRKSAIYKKTAEFSMFGVGRYSYAKYKVGISGFYKKPLFSLLYNENKIEHPIMLDDTSYFLSFDNYDEAYTCMLLLNSNVVQRFLQSISFQDAKRPYTKKVLQRVDLKKCIEKVSIEDMKQTEKNLGLKEYISNEIYSDFKNILD